MTGLWIAVAVMASAAAAWLLWPLVRRTGRAPSRAEYDIVIYRDQLTEVERDLERGLFGAEQAKAARIEIQRRMLATAEDSEAVTRTAVPAARRPLAAATIALLVPAGAIGLYLHLGSPDVPDQPLAARQAALQTAAQGRADMTGLVERLARRMETTPGDLDGWMLLARTYRSLDRFAEAAEAFRRAVRASGRQAAVLSAWGEARILAREGMVAAEDVAIFEEVMQKDPRDPRAHFYMGVFKAHRGDLRGALQAWGDLEAISPSDAPWLPDLRQRIAGAAKELGIEVGSASVGGGGAPGPSAADVEAASRMSAGDRDTMIRTMVEGLAERLAENPDDLEGWLRLARSYEVLGETAKAREARARAGALKAGRP